MIRYNESKYNKNASNLGAQSNKAFSFHAGSASMPCMANLGIVEAPFGERKKRNKNSVQEKIQSNKKKKYSGEDHQQRNGKKVARREFTYHVCNCKRLNCNESVSYEARKQIFSDFLHLSNWTLQEQYLLNHISIKTTRRKDDSQDLKKEFVRIYRLGDEIVCKEVFLKTLGVSSGRVDYLLKNKLTPSKTTVDKDNRGNLYLKTLSEERLNDLKSFLNSIPIYSSHYSDSGRLYFPPGQTTVSLFKEYRSKVQNPICLSVFRDFLKSYKVKFYVPKVDSCRRCDQLKIEMDQKKSAGDIDEFNKLARQLEDHHFKASLPQKMIKSISKNNNVSNDTIYFSFDLERTLPCPHFPSSIVFYKRQLWVYNCGINEINLNKGTMCVWAENNGKRGSQEINSCIESFLNDRGLNGVKHLKSFSDNCPGQNKSRNTVMFIFYIVHAYRLDSWSHSYMEAGHSFLPNDRDFSHIEKIKKEEERIYEPKDWIRLIRNKRNFKVIEMNGQFKKYDSLESHFEFGKKNERGIDFKWTEMKSLRVANGSSFLEYKTTVDENTPWERIKVLKSGLDEVAKMKSTKFTVPISTAKWKDLQDLCKLIPVENRPFFENLPHIAKRGDIFEDIIERDEL